MFSSRRNGARTTSPSKIVSLAQSALGYCATNVRALFSALGFSGKQNKTRIRSASRRSLEESFKIWLCRSYHVWNVGSVEYEPRVTRIRAPAAHKRGSVAPQTVRKSHLHQSVRKSHVPISDVRLTEVTRSARLKPATHSARLQRQTSVGQQHLKL